MSKTNIIEWHPNVKGGFPETIFIEALHDDYEGFRIIVRGGEPSKVYRISFAYDYLGYRNFDESERLKSLPLFPKDSRKWCLFKTDQSDFIDWLVEESKEIQKKEEVTHYFIATPNDILEVLSLNEPLIEKL